MAYTSNPNAPKVRRDAVLFSDKYDIRTGTPSTVIEVHDGTITLLREGSVLFSEIVENLATQK